MPAGANLLYYDYFYAREHDYVVYEWIAPIGTPGVTIDTVFQALRSYPAPGASGIPVNSGDTTEINVVGLSGGAVTHYVHEEAYTVSNVTQDGHVFHSGVVNRMVMEADGWYVIRTWGTGTGPYAGINEVIGDGTWDLQSNSIREKVIELGGEETEEQRDEIFERKNKCFAAGTQIDMADGSQKPIEAIEVGDEVMAYDPEAEAGRGGLKPARVTRTMVNQVPHLLDFHGVKVTPGHATLCGDGPNEGNHIPLMDILLADGAVVNRDGELVRAATNLPVGSEGDQFVEVAWITSKSQKTFFRGRMRAGTLTLDVEGKTHRVLDALNREGYRLLPDGLIAKDGETPHPLYWFGELPKPADYVLAKSGLTLAELCSAEGQELDRPTAPASSSKIGAELGAVYAGMSVN